MEREFEKKKKAKIESKKGKLNDNIQKIRTLKNNILQYLQRA